jgi:hypothetical protein
MKKAHILLITYALILNFNISSSSLQEYHYDFVIKMQLKAEILYN